MYRQWRKNPRKLLRMFQLLYSVFSDIFDCRPQKVMYNKYYYTRHYHVNGKGTIIHNILNGSENNAAVLLQ